MEGFGCGGAVAVRVDTMLNSILGLREKGDVFPRAGISPDTYRYLTSN